MSTTVVVVSPFSPTVLTPVGRCSDRLARRRDAGSTDPTPPTRSPSVTTPAGDPRREVPMARRDHVRWACRLCGCLSVSLVVGSVTVVAHTGRPQTTQVPVSPPPSMARSTPARDIAGQPRKGTAVIRGRVVDGASGVAFVARGSPSAPPISVRTAVGRRAPIWPAATNSAIFRRHDTGSKWCVVAICRLNMGSDALESRGGPSRWRTHRSRTGSTSPYRA